MKKVIVCLAAIFAALSAFAGMSNSLELTQLYIIGSATEYDWDLASSPEMNRISSGVFQWQGTLKGGQEFKFMNTRECWHKHIVASEPNISVSAGSIYQLDFYADWQLSSEKDLKFRAPSETGTYLITIDLNSMLMSIERTPAPLQMPQQLFATGSALNGEFVELTPLGNVEFKAAMELRPGNIILTDRPELNGNTRLFGPLFEDVDLGFGEGMKCGIVECAVSSRGWSVAVAGKYTLYISLDGMSARGRMFKPRKALYIVGGCCELSWNYWDPSNCVFCPLESSPEKLVWEGRLEIGRNEGPEPEKFKILTEQNWFAETYHPYSADEDAESSAYFRTSGGDDTKWTISRNGEYRITVDTWKETISIICQPDPISENINGNAGSEIAPVMDSDGQAPEETYDISGRRMPAGAPLPAGVYIVRKPGSPARRILLY